MEAHMESPSGRGVPVTIWRVEDVLFMATILKIRAKFSNAFGSSTTISLVG
jgi:hypothetical protein